MPAIPERALRLFSGWAVSALVTATAWGQSSELVDALGSDRAVLHFKVPSQPSPDAPAAFELLAVSASGTERYEAAGLLPGGATSGGPHDLEKSVYDFIRRLRQGRGADGRDARRWHRALGLDAALDALPPTVSRLVLVVDDGAPGELRRLPFGRLLDAAGDPLAARYSLTWAPSLEVWLALASRRPSPGAVAIFAPGPDRAQVAAAIRRRFAGRTFAGSEASPSTLHGLDLLRFTALHLPASFPGMGATDGPGLDLGGKLTVLTADESDAADPLAASRGAFRAGATSAVVERWPLPPPAAAAFYADLYGALTSGLDVATATQDAQDRSRRRGDPPAVWAGVAVVGRGDAVFKPLLPPLERWILRILSGLVVASMVIAACAFWWTQIQGRMPLHNPWRPGGPPNP
ncbi:MAG: CHAT domain-containing protein [Acidobacteriota bacterium]